MARLWACGFELQTTTVTVEWATTTNGSPAIDTSVKRSGAAALRINNAAANENIIHAFRTTTSQGPYWSRLYFYITAAPSTDRIFVNWMNSSNPKVSVRIRTGANARKLQLFNDEDSVQIGSDSSALAVDTWYRLEMFVDDTTLSSTSVEARLYDAADETTLLWNPSGTADITASPNRFRIGTNGADATFDMVFDDIAINDSSGTYQNSWPGEGELIILRPDADSGTPQWTRGGTDSGANWSQVEEVTPDDVTTYVESATLDQVDEYTLEATPAALDTNDEINWVGPGARFAVSSTSGADPDFVLRLKSGSDFDETGNLSGAGSTIYNTNSTVEPKNYPALGNNSNHEVPNTSTAWTKTTLDSAILGIRQTFTDTHTVRVSSVWLYVDHKPGGAPPTGQPTVKRMAGVSHAYSNNSQGSSVW